METTLYPPVKAFLESLGFAVKGEIGGCDLLALREGEPPLVVVCELKQRFNLDLVLQGVDRAKASDEVWLAASVGRSKGREHDRRFRDLCRRLGFGLLGVTGRGEVQIIVSPAAAAPRRDPKRRSRLVEEHRRRQGDPAVGGGSRVPIMTAYRQQALLCAAAMTAAPARPRDLKGAAPKAATILRANVYGWFVRVDRGLYGVTDAGRAALARWPQAETATSSAGADDALETRIEIAGLEGFGGRSKTPPSRPLDGSGKAPRLVGPDPGPMALATTARKLAEALPAAQPPKLARRTKSR